MNPMATWPRSTSPSASIRPATATISIAAASTRSGSAAFLHPSLLTFDAPTREECTINRVNSNTPLQALVLLNDPIYVEAARVFAQNILQHGRDWNARVDWAFERAAGRTPVPEERSALSKLYTSNLAQFQRSPADARALIA